MSDDQDLVMREKDPSEYGPKKFYVEMFISERFVASVYADDGDSAVVKAMDSMYISDKGLKGFKLANGVAHVQHDSDLVPVITRGDVQEADEDE